MISNVVLPVMLIGIATAAATTVLAGPYRQYGELALIVLMPLAAGIMGYLAGAGKKQRAPEASHPSGRPAEPDNGSEKLTGELSDLLGCSVQMLQNGDLIDRYRSFNELTERLLNRLAGRCSVSLWCLESNQNLLVECVSGMIHGTGETRSGGHQPCRVPVRGESVVNALKTGRPYFEAGASPSRPAGSDPNGWHACIPLYRAYGQPLLVMIEWAGFELFRTPEKRAMKIHFDRAAEIVRLVWQQLQTVNERQWQMEHDEFSRTLRADVFLERGQEWADQCAKKDESFSLAVVSVRGFRRLFAGQSQTWNQISGLIGGSLGDLLNRSGKAYLLGRMADDVFALILPRTDAYLAGQIMQSSLSALSGEIAKKQAAGPQDIVSIDLVWTLAGHRHRCGRLADQLDRIYRDLFGNDARPENRHEVRLNLQDSPSGVK